VADWTRDVAKAGKRLWRRFVAAKKKRHIAANAVQ